MDRIYVMQLVRSFQVGQISRRVFAAGERGRRRDGGGQPAAGGLSAGDPRGGGAPGDRGNADGRRWGRPRRT